MKGTLIVEQIYGFVQHYMANLLKKRLSLRDENSTFYTKNTILNHFVAGSILILVKEKFSYNQIKPQLLRTIR